jgi:hypothetical protein
LLRDDSGKLFSRRFRRWFPTRRIRFLRYRRAVMLSIFFPRGNKPTSSRRVTSIHREVVSSLPVMEYLFYPLNTTRGDIRMILHVFQRHNKIVPCPSTAMSLVPS